MLKRWHVALGGALLIAFAILLLVGATWSPSYQKCEAEHEGDQRQTKYSDFHHGIAVAVVCEGVFANENGSAIAAFATIALVVSTIGLWIVTGRAANAAKEAAEVIPDVERAYLFVNDIRTVGDWTDVILPSPPDGGGTRKEIEFRSGKLAKYFKNHGKTPATIKSIKSTVRYFSGAPVLAGYDMELPDASFIVGTRELSDPFCDSINIPQDEWKTAQSIQGGVYAIGVVTYQDIFRRTRETGFCWKYNFYDGKFYVENSALNYFT